MEGHALAFWQKYVDFFEAYWENEEQPEVLLGSVPNRDAVIEKLALVESAASDEFRWLVRRILSHEFMKQPLAGVQFDLPNDRKALKSKYWELDVGLRPSTAGRSKEEILTTFGVCFWPTSGGNVGFRPTIYIWRDGTGRVSDDELLSVIRNSARGRPWAHSLAAGNDVYSNWSFGSVVTHVFEARRVPKTGAFDLETIAEDVIRSFEDLRESGTLKEVVRLAYGR